jgi:glucose-1-phosphate thymidylyltransferase
MYPLTLNTPKPLLDVAGRTILDRIIDKLERTPGIDECIIVSNSKFVDHFQDWARQRTARFGIPVLDDGSTDNDNRLGAVADIHFAVKQHAITDDLLVLAGDNLFDFELADFAAFFKKTGCDCITTHRLDDIEQLRRTGVIEVDDAWKVLSFEEKPAMPKTHLAVPPFYIYRKDTLPLFENFLQEGQNADAPGNFIPWLLTRKPVTAFFFPGKRYDVGSLKSYEAVCKAFDKD